MCVADVPVSHGMSMLCWCTRTYTNHRIARSEGNTKCVSGYMQATCGTQVSQALRTISAYRFARVDDA